MSPCRHLSLGRHTLLVTLDPPPRGHAVTPRILACGEGPHRRVVWHRHCIVPELRTACMGAQRSATRWQAEASAYNDDPRIDTMLAG